MNQIFALRFYYVDYKNDTQEEEDFLDDEAKFFHNFRGGTITKVENYNAQVEGGVLPGSLFSNFSKNYVAKKVRISTERPISVDEFNQLLSEYLGIKDKGIIKIEAIEELAN